MNAGTQTTPLVTIKPLYLAREQAAAFLSISESMLESLSARGEAPKPRKLSAGRTAWLVEELEAWGRDRPVSDLLPPKGSGHGRAGRIRPNVELPGIKKQTPLCRGRTIDNHGPERPSEGCRSASG